MKPLQVNAYLDIKVLRVHDQKEKVVPLKQAEQELSTAEKARERAQAYEHELVGKAHMLRLKLERVEAEDHERRKAAALAGESVRPASEESRAPAIRVELEDLAYQVWGARVRRAQAEVEVFERRAPVVAARARDLRAKLERAEKRVREAEAKRDEIRDELGRVGDPFFEQKRAREARQRAAAIEADPPSPASRS